MRSVLVPPAWGNSARSCTRGAVRVLIAVAFTSLLSVPARADAVDDGLAAFGVGRFAEAVLSWRVAADAGEARGLLMLAAAYDIGAGVSQDYPLAVSLYRRAAMSGSAAASLDVGLMYDAGRGVPRDAVEAVAWYRRGAELGSPRAAFVLGLILQSGDVGVARDRAGAVAAFSRARDLGVPEAATRLAALGVRPALVSRVPAARVVAAAPDLGALLAEAGGRVRAADVLALRSAAERGDGAAAYDLAFCYERGTGVAVDRVAALAWYGRAASSSDPRLADLASRAVRRLEGAASR